MSGTIFGGAFVVGAAVLAAWVDRRFDKQRPESVVRRIGHALAAYVALRMALVGSDLLLGAVSSSQQRLTVLFILVLPGLVYVFLAGLWLMRTLADVARLARH
jgi:hypothetical protein